MSDRPYGPNTVPIRRFLVRLAGLGLAQRVAVVEQYQKLVVLSAWHAAEGALSTAIERSAREGFRDALSGPLLQLVRPTNVTAPTDDDEWLNTLDPIAEPALAALLGLLVSDLLPAQTLHTLLAPFDGTMPLSEINASDASMPAIDR